VEHDTWQLFYDMHRYNPYAQDKRAALMQAMQKINDEIKRYDDTTKLNQESIQWEKKQRTEKY
jgi:hypothetical protein